MKFSKLLDYLYEIDFYGTNFSLRYKKRKKFPTKLGISLSLPTIVFTITFIMIYLIDIINKKSFTLYSYSQK